jgi:hypothetical protein
MSLLYGFRTARLSAFGHGVLESHQTYSTESRMRTPPDGHPLSGHRHLGWVIPEAFLSETKTNVLHQCDEQLFKLYVLQGLGGWVSQDLSDDYPYGFKLSDKLGDVRIQVKMRSGRRVGWQSPSMG